VRACGTNPANSLENLLDELELVGRERVACGEVCLVPVLLEGHSAVRERDLVFEDVPLSPKDVAEVLLNVLPFREQT